MPVVPSYPGVYIEEIPSGVRTISSIATSITAFIGRTLRGPVNEPISINSYGDFERIFGGLWVESTLGYAVRDFYLNGGSQSVIVRLFKPTEVDPKVRKVAIDLAEAVTAATDLSAGKDAAKAKAGEIDKTDVSDAEKKAAKAVSEVIQKVTDPEQLQEKINAAVKEMFPNNIKAQLSLGDLILEAAYEGAWGNNLLARVDYDFFPPITEPTKAENEKLFNLSVKNNNSGQVEVFRNVSVLPGHPRQIDNVLKNESQLVRVYGELSLSKERPPNNDAEFIQDSQGTDDKKKKEAEATLKKPPFDNEKRHVKVEDNNKATDGSTLDNNSFTGPGMEGSKKGLYALEKADLFSLLCIPPHQGDGGLTDVDADLIDSAIAYCKKRRAMLIIDAPSSWNDKDKAKENIEKSVGSVSENAAIFFPRLKQPNPLKNNQIEVFAACGAIAGVFSRTDTQRGIWKAPAGLEATLVGVPELSVPLTDGEIGELNPLGINCLRTVPAAGRVIWGSRTRIGDDRLASEWKYISVRRLALYIQESLYRGTQWIVFEPNDEPLWAQIRLNLGAFMNNLFRKGAFQGSSPKEAYFVKCDKETTTQNDIDLGIVNIVVGFAPLKPAEFVIIKFQQIAGEIAG